MMVGRLSRFLLGPGDFSGANCYVKLRGRTLFPTKNNNFINSGVQIVSLRLSPLSRTTQKKCLGSVCFEGSLSPEVEPSLT